MSTEVNKENVTQVLSSFELKSKTDKKMKDNLKKILLESEEEVIDDLGTAAPSEEEIIDDLGNEGGENLETPAEEEQEFIDVTGGVQEQDGIFTVGGIAEVKLAPGNKIKFVVGDEEFTGTIGERIDPEDEESPLTIELSDDLPETSEETPIDDIDDELPVDDEPIEDEENLLEESIIEEVLSEIDGPDAEVPTEATPGMESGGVEETPIEDDLDGGAGDLGDGGIGMSTAAPSSGPIGSAPGVDGPGADLGTEQPPIENDTDLEQIVDYDELIDNLLNTEEQPEPLDIELARQISEEVIEEVISEAVNKANPEYKGVAKEAKPSTKLNTQEITGTVKGATEKQTVPGVQKFKANPVAKQGDVQSKKLKTDEPTSTVAATKATKETPADITTKVKQGGDSHVDPKDDFTSKIKADSAVKSKALVNLAEDLIKVQNENKTLRLENYKLLKLNGLLTLLPELEQTTREQLAEKFDRCSSDSQVIALYKKVVGVVKESRKPSLNQIVTEQRKDVRVFTEGRAHDERLLREKVEGNQKDQREILSEDQIRKNELMGIGSGDGYFKHNI